MQFPVSDARPETGKIKTDHREQIGDQQEDGAGLMQAGVGKAKLQMTRMPIPCRQIVE